MWDAPEKKVKNMNKSTFIDEHKSDVFTAGLILV